MKITTFLLEVIVSGGMEKRNESKNIFESIRATFWSYIARRKTRKLIQKVKDKPLQFREGFTAEKARFINPEH